MSETKDLILAIESSCDETSVAVIENGEKILSNIVASQIKSHRRFGGVVPEIASRHHVEQITLCIDDALAEANVEAKDLCAVAVTSMILYGTIIFILPEIIEEKKFTRILQIILGIFILLIGMSRIYLGVHFPTDIVGGYSLGLAWLLFTYPIYDQKRFVWQFSGKQK